MSGNPDLKGIDPLLIKDIVELKENISKFKKGEYQEDRFKHYRLTRGVYGQRQLGVHMFRTKIPYGKLTCEQLECLANTSEKYTNGNLHLTTRQNIQFHHVKLDDAPGVWSDLAKSGVNAREACGNTVRNLTASSKAGIDPDEPFDVSPYTQATYEYFLRNPICQDMGRKIKPAFSSSEKDTAFTYFHDFGFIPRIKILNGKEVRGFKVVVGGGLGAQSIIAPTAYEFLPTDKIIPFMEAAIRVFDRYGEREKRFKARMKFLVKSLGLEAWMKIVEDEMIANKFVSYPISPSHEDIALPNISECPSAVIKDSAKFELWKKTNTFIQKQADFCGVTIKVLLGDIHAEKARQLAKVVKKWAADDIRITVNQGFLLRYIKPENLPNLYADLDQLGLAETGFDSTADITACPGTVTCNLAVTNSTAISIKLEELIRTEYPALIQENNILIKISGCMNACGQHMAAQIGLHGSSIKKKNMVIPAMQIVMGGGVDHDGTPNIAERVIKLPTRRIPQALREILNDYEKNASDGEYFNHYYRRVEGKRYFYSVLKHLGDVETITENDFIDWGEDHKYIQAIGVGECAGVSYDLVGAIVKDAEDRIQWAQESNMENSHADSIYHAYSAMVIGAKALLLTKDIKCNTHIGIIDDFDEHYVKTNDFKLKSTFRDHVLQIKRNEPSKKFSNQYLKEAELFVSQMLDIRKSQLLKGETADKEVIGNYYKA